MPRPEASSAGLPKATDTAPGRAAITAFASRHGVRIARLEALAGDVSPRRYYRLWLEDGGTAVAAVYPPDQLEASGRFLRTSELLASAGVRVPEVRAADCAAGLMLLEDVGPATLADRTAAPWGDLEPCFRHALEVAERIAALPPASVTAVNPPLDAARLRSELDQTWDALLVARGMTGPPALADELAAALDALCARLGEEPPAPCHRDFMARNLAPVEPRPRLAVLDHQDLRLGPPLYDLASLLNDSLFPPPAVEERLLVDFLPPAARARYHRAAAQRTLKAAGTYAAFAHRGHPRHVPLIVPTLARALVHLEHAPETATLAPRLAAIWREAGVPSISTIAAVRRGSGSA